MSKQLFAVYEGGALSKKIFASVNATPSMVKRAAKVDKSAGVIADSATVYEKRKVREATRFAF